MTGVQTCALPISESRKPGSVWQLLMALRECELKNDALLLSLCEYIGERYQPGFSYGIYVFHGNYDVPLKGSDKVQQRESEEVYSFIVCAICPVTGDYEAGEPEAGFLFPEFRDRSGEPNGINLYSAQGEHGWMSEMLLQADGRGSEGVGKTGKSAGGRKPAAWI